MDLDSERDAPGAPKRLQQPEKPVDTTETEGGEPEKKRRRMEVPFVLIDPPVEQMIVDHVPEPQPEVQDEQQPRGENRRSSEAEAAPTAPELSPLETPEVNGRGRRRGGQRGGRGRRRRNQGVVLVDFKTQIKIVKNLESVDDNLRQEARVDPQSFKVRNWLENPGRNIHKETLQNFFVKRMKGKKTAKFDQYDSPDEEEGQESDEGNEDEAELLRGASRLSHLRNSQGQHEMTSLSGLSGIPDNQQRKGDDSSILSDGDTLGIIMEQTGIAEEEEIPVEKDVSMEVQPVQPEPEMEMAPPPTPPPNVEENNVPPLFSSPEDSFCLRRARIINVDAADVVDRLNVLTDYGNYLATMDELIRALLEECDYDGNERKRGKYFKRMAAVVFSLMLELQVKKVVAMEQEDEDLQEIQFAPEIQIELLQAA